MKYIATLVDESGEMHEAIQELYDISIDPLEPDELSAEKPVEAEVMRARARRSPAGAIVGARTEDVSLDEDVTEQLKSLGYIE